MRWHTDDEPLHFDRSDIDHTFYAILSWSFGASRTFLVRHKRTGVIDRVLLSSGDVISMNQNFQFQYHHWLVMFSLTYANFDLKTHCSIPDDPNVSQWRLNLTFRWIVNHHASSLGCRNDTRSCYRPVFIPTSHFPGHLLGVTYQPKAREVRTEEAFRPGSIVSIVQGVLTKSPTEFELANFAIELMDHWYLLPTTTIPQHPAIKFMRGEPVGSFIRKSSIGAEGNVVFSHLEEESDRVWLLCRETGVFHFVRPVGVVALQHIDRKAYVRATNTLKHPMNMSSFDRKRMGALSSSIASMVSGADSVTGSAREYHRSSRTSRRDSRRRRASQEVSVPAGPWVEVLNGNLALIFLNWHAKIFVNPGFIAKMLSEGADNPLRVTVAPGHVVTICPEVDRSTGQRIISNILLFIVHVI